MSIRLVLLMALLVCSTAQAGIHSSFVQHGANENLRLQNLWDAIEIYAAVLTGLGG